MGGEVIDFIVFLVVVCLIAAVVLWAVRKFFPDIYPVARYVVGAFALIAILIKLKPIIAAAMG